ncbi:MAG TPA: GNAT family N-acetyltransferase [Allosphingosinicella sp.]|jgi:ribosomal protein S18 acetylase RimI-like enzyme
MPPPLRAAAGLGIGYRPIADADLPFLARVYASTRMEELAQTGWPERMVLQFLARQFALQHSHYMEHYLTAEWLVIERAGTPVGRLYIDQWESEVRIVDIALLPEARGGGIGGAILADVIAEAERLGKPLTIHVEQNNPAMTLYRRLGFEKTGEHGVYHLMERRPGRG